MVVDWLLGWLLPQSPNQTGVGGFVLFAVQLLVLVVQLYLIGRGRRHALESERHAVRASEYARRDAADRDP